RDWSSDVCSSDLVAEEGDHKKLVRAPIQHLQCDLTARVFRDNRDGGDFRDDYTAVSVVPAVPANGSGEGFSIYPRNLIKSWLAAAMPSISLMMLPSYSMPI